MASSSRRSAGDRVLESKHVIGLFLLMLVFSGIFFTLGYVMGRNQYDGQVRAFSSASSAEPILTKKTEASAQNSSRKNTPVAVPSSEIDPALKSDPSWEFSENNQPARSEPRLETPPKNVAPQPSAKTISPKTSAPQPAPAPAPASSPKPGKNTLNAPLIPSGAIVLQVAALVKQDDALVIAGNLQKKHFAAYVQTPLKDKFYRVQVGPFKDKKAADAAKKGLENEGFKAFYAVH
jgi:cell division septation protein DedD